MYSGDKGVDFKLKFSLAFWSNFWSTKRLLQCHNVPNLLQLKQLLKHMGSPSLQMLDP